MNIGARHNAMRATFIISGSLAAMAYGGEVTDIADLRQVFVDHALIESMHGVSLRLHWLLFGRCRATPWRSI